MFLMHCGLCTIVVFCSGVISLECQLEFLAHLNRTFCWFQMLYNKSLLRLYLTAKKGLNLCSFVLHKLYYILWFKKFRTCAHHILKIVCVVGIYIIFCCYKVDWIGLISVWDEV